MDSSKAVVQPKKLRDPRYLPAAKSINDLLDKKQYADVSQVSPDQSAADEQNAKDYAKQEQQLEKKRNMELRRKQKQKQEEHNKAKEMPHDNLDYEECTKENSIQDCAHTLPSDLQQNYYNCIKTNLPIKCIHT